MQAFSAGTLAGVGCFRCGACGFGIALRERDQVPECPGCGHRQFRRASMFWVPKLVETQKTAPRSPEWLDEARDGLVTPGDYLAFEDRERVQVVALEEGWTRIGRSMSADIRFDDPTVSRRHAWLYRDQRQARVLDDRSLNGVFRNGRRVGLEDLEDGDEIAIGRFHLYFLRVPARAERTSEEMTSAAG